jgi:hypothetical protein
VLEALAVVYVLAAGFLLGFAFGAWYVRQKHGLSR